MALDLSALQAEVTRDNDVDSSASTLITRLADLVAQTKGDPAAVDALVSQLRAQSDALAAAVTANTPSDTPAARAKRGK
jgi:hypothetical protein